MARPALRPFSTVFIPLSNVCNGFEAFRAQERLEQRFGKKPPKPAVEAEKLLERSELPKLTDFYRALVDAYPGAIASLSGGLEALLTYIVLFCFRVCDI